MTTEKLKIGEKIYLEFRLENREENRFLLATLLDEFGNEIPQSPVSPVHQSDGVYSYDDANLVFPSNTVRIKASLDVYLDSGFTNLDPNYFGQMDIYSLDTSSSTASNQREIIGVLQASVSDQTIKAVVGNDELAGEVEETQEITGTVEENEVVTGEATSETVTATAEESN